MTTASEQRLQPQIEPILVSHAECAALLGISEKLLDQCLVNLDMPTVRCFGNRKMYCLQSVREWIYKRSIAGTSLEVKGKR